MTEEEREPLEGARLPAALPSRYGMNPTTCAAPTRSRSSWARARSRAAAGCCSGRRSPTAWPRCATCRRGSTSGAPAATDWTGPDDLEIKIGELREITDWEKPIYIKVGATRPYFDTALAVKAGADVVVMDGMQGGTAATQEVFIEHAGIPTLAAIRPAVDALQDLGVHREVQLIVSGESATAPMWRRRWRSAPTRSRSASRR